MGFRLVSVFFLLGFMPAAHLQALPLAPIPAPSQERLPIDKDAPPIDCDQIIPRLEKYNEMARSHDLSLTSFLGEVVQKMNEWHGQLQPLEGTPREIPLGTFSVLEDGAGKISLVTDKAFDNTDLLANELDRIIQSLRECSETNKSRKSKRTGG